MGNTWCSHMGQRESRAHQLCCWINLKNKVLHIKGKEFVCSHNNFMRLGYCILVSLTMDKSPKQNLILNLAADAGLTAEPRLTQVGKQVPVQVVFPPGHLSGGFQKEQGCRVGLELLPSPVFECTAR